MQGRGVTDPGCRIGDDMTLIIPSVISTRCTVIAFVDSGIKVSYVFEGEDYTHVVRPGEDRLEKGQCSTNN